MNTLRLVSPRIATMGKGKRFFFKLHSIQDEKYVLMWDRYSRKAMLPVSVYNKDLCELFGLSYEGHQLSLPLLRHHPHSKAFWPVVLKPYLHPDINVGCKIIFGRRSKKLIEYIRVCLLGENNPAQWVGDFPDEWIDVNHCYPHFYRAQVRELINDYKLSQKRVWNLLHTISDHDHFLVSDTLNMLKAQGRVDIPDGRTMADIHTRVRREYLLFMAKKDDFSLITDATQSRFGDILALDGESSGLGRYVIPKTNSELVLWGSDQVLSNCIPVYGRYQADGACVLIGLERDGQIIAAAEINRSAGSFIVRQVSTRGNIHYREWERELTSLIAPLIGIHRDGEPPRRF